MGIKRSASPVMVVRVLDAVMMLASNTVLMKGNATSSFTSLQHLDASFIIAALKPELLLTLGQQLKSLVQLLSQRKLQQV